VRAILLAAILAAFVMATYRVLTADVDWLLTVVPDDAFYYLQIARHISTTGESTFDGLSATNGYHPLWMAMLTAVAAVVHDNTTLLRIALGVCLALHACAAVLLFHAIRCLVGDAWGRTAGACWLVNPLAFSLAISGTEAALDTLAALTVVLAHIALLTNRQAGKLPTPGLAGRYGLALGFMSLARTDGLVIAGLGLTWLASSCRLKKQNVTQRRSQVLIAGAAFALTVGPWWLFSLTQVGTIVQDSGAMKMLWASAAFSTPIDRLHNIGSTVDFFTRRTVALMTVWNYSLGTFIVVAAGMAIAPALLLVRHAATIQAQAVRAVSAAVIALTMVYGAAFVERQIWWLAVPGLSIALVMFTAFPTMLRSLRIGRGRDDVTLVFLLLLALVLFGRWHLKGYAPYPWQPDVRRSQLAIEAIVPPQERIGCFNAGIPAFFGSTRVVALDGLVSHDARLSWTDRRLDEYVARHQIRYIADEEVAMLKAQNFVHTPLQLRAIASYPLRGWPTGRRVLWHVEPRSENSNPLGPPGN
jgi:hypothetical protein